MIYRIDRIILIFVFGLTVYTPFLLGITQEDKKISHVEKRNLASFPSLPKSLKTLNEYPKDINTYYSDHFGLREEYTKAYFKLMRKFTDQSTADDVTFGQDGWMFLGSIKPGYQAYNDPIGHAINIYPFTKMELEDYVKSIVTIKNWLNDKGIKYVFIIAPNKHSIYFDKLPEYISKKNPESVPDQIINYLREHTDVSVVDLRPALLEEKKKHHVYLKSDTHWNHYGANVAQFELMKKIDNLFPGRISPELLSDDQFTISTKTKYDLALFAKMDNHKEDMPEPVFESGCDLVREPPIGPTTDVHTFVCETGELNAIIFRDSFFGRMQPYVSREFYRSTYIWERINYNSLVKYIEQENPDVVIDEVLERFLPHTPSSASFQSAAQKDMEKQVSE